MLAIAQAEPPLNQAHVTVDPDQGEEITARGHVTAGPREDGSVEVTIDGGKIFDLEPTRLRGAWLWTFDGAA